MGIISSTARATVRGAVRHATAPPPRPAPGGYSGTVMVREQNAPRTTRPQPPRPPIDGSVLLSNLVKWLKRYLYLDSEAKYTALALWIAGTHFRDEHGVLVHETYPIAGFLSSDPGSGKTHALECLSILCPAAPSILTEPSEAAIARLIGKHKRTLLLDEGDILFATGRRKASIRAILNSGYKKGGTWPRASHGDVEDVPTYGAKAIAALLVAKTATGSSLDALFTRILEFIMCKPPAGHVMHKLREVFKVTDANGEAHRVTGRDLGEHLAAQMTEWAAQERDALAADIPELPEGVELREEEKWLPLLAVAERAWVNWHPTDEDEREGPDWRELAWAACMDLSLYGGTPDSAPQYASVADAIMDQWDSPAAGGPGDDSLSEPGPAPAGQFKAGYYRTENGQETGSEWFPGPFGTIEDAQRACQDHAGGGALPWKYAGQRTWGASIIESGVETDYVVTEKE